MKKVTVTIVMAVVLFSSCQKRKCKEDQAKALATQLEQFQQQVSNTNLTQQQIEAITKQFQAKQKEILAECN